MILKGLIYIHKINLIHQYIKGSNILFSEDGYAKLDETDDDYRTSKKGSPYWMSPQVVLNEKYKQKMWGNLWEKNSLYPPKVEEINEINEHTDEFVDFFRLCLEI